MDVCWGPVVGSLGMRHPLCRAREEDECAVGPLIIGDAGTQGVAVFCSEYDNIQGMYSKHLANDAFFVLEDSITVLVPYEIL